MSVINQMLKDLEQRSPKSNGHTVQPGNVELAYSPRKIALVTGICVLVFCFISFYVWQLNNENSLLKANTVNVDKQDNNAQQLVEKNIKQILSSQGYMIFSVIHIFRKK